MRDDQLSRQWRIIRAIEASPNGMTVADIAFFLLNVEAVQAIVVPLYTAGREFPCHG